MRSDIIIMTYGERFGCGLTKELTTEAQRGAAATKSQRAVLNRECGLRRRVRAQLLIRDPSPPPQRGRRCRRRMRGSSHCDKNRRFRAKNPQVSSTEDTEISVLSVSLWFKRTTAPTGNRRRDRSRGRGRCRTFLRDGRWRGGGFHSRRRRGCRRRRSTPRDGLRSGATRSSTC
jgi:hypothetical protein